MILKPQGCGEVCCDALNNASCLGCTECALDLHLVCCHKDERRARHGGVYGEQVARCQE